MVSASSHVHVCASCVWLHTLYSYKYFATIKSFKDYFLYTNVCDYLL